MQAETRERPATAPLPLDWGTPTAGQGEAIARLEFVVDRGWQAADLVGPAGTGKTRVADWLVDRTQRRGLEATRIDTSLVPNDGLPTSILEGLHRPCHHEPWQALRDAVAAMEAVRERAVVVCDHVTTTEAFTALERLRRAAGRAITVVAVGRQLPARELRIEVAPFDAIDTQSFLTAWCDATGTALTADVVESLHEAAAGLPGRLRQLAELAALANRGEGTLDTDTIRAATAEFHAIGG